MHFYPKRTVAVILNAISASATVDIFKEGTRWKGMEITVYCVEKKINRKTVTYM